MIPPIRHEEAQMIERLLGAPAVDFEALDLLLEEDGETLEEIDDKLTRVLDMHKESGDPQKEERYVN